MEFGRGGLTVPECDVLLLAGDILVPHLQNQKQNARDKVKKRYKKFFKEVHEKCGQTYMIMGNHEHYDGVLGETKAAINNYIDQYPTITLLDNEEVLIGEDIALFGATMWTDYNKENPEVMHMANRRMNDHECIIGHRGSGPYDVSTRFRAVDAVKENKFTRQKIVEFLSKYKDDKLTFVMTHHAPSWACVSRGFSIDILSYAYANTGLDDMILDGDGPAFWIHGHMHKRDMFDHGKTKIICNARGYFRHQRTEDFEWKTLDVSFEENVG